jgi:chorismate mutase
MQQPVRPLEDLRREIDEVDDAIHDLVMRRTAIVAAIAAAKAAHRGGRDGFLRPGREAALLRRLIARHRGPFPKPALVRLWREIISAPLSLQGRFAVAVYAPGKQPGYWDLARDHYGSHTPFSAHSTPGQVIGALVDGGATVGVLPDLQDGGGDPWWPLLVREDRRMPAIMARLPLAGAGNARGEHLRALVVGDAVPERTGRDHSYLVFDANEEISRTRLGAQLGKAELKPIFFANWQEPEGSRRLYLVELEDFVAEGDPRLAAFLKGEEGVIRRVFSLGSYALPFAAEELAPGLGEPR